MLRNSFENINIYLSGGEKNEVIVISFLDADIEKKFFC